MAAARKGHVTMENRHGLAVAGTATLKVLQQTGRPFSVSAFTLALDCVLRR
jgi:hypothetical protein